jgi:hypothetical protein
MVTIIPDTSTDYLYVDGTETITLTDDDENSASVQYAKRSRVEASEQLSGMQVGDVLWDLPMAQMDGAITEPLAGMKITDGNDPAKTFVIVAVRTLVISEIWQCYTRKGTI